VAVAVTAVVVVAATEAGFAAAVSIVDVAGGSDIVIAVRRVSDTNLGTLPK
jgi:hypothetical protein